MAEPAKPLEQPAPVAPSLRRLKKGELLFKEGDNSRSMYFIRRGMIRLYKKKGSSVIELNTVHTGEVLGELAFLDGNPRSASGEALNECELVEISSDAFQKTLGKMPEWLKILLKTIVARLRTASTRIRQLESVSTAYDYSSKDGRRSVHYIYLSPSDVLKICTGVLLVTCRYGEEIKISILQRYSNQIMGIPVAKISSLLDILAETSIIEMNENQNSTQIILRDIDFLEDLITYLNDENLLEPSKRHDINVREYFILGLINKHLVKYKKDELTGLSTVNLAEIRSVETAMTGKQPFRIDELQRFVELGYMDNLRLMSGSEVLTCIDSEKFSKSYRLQKVVMAIHSLNERKRVTGGK